MEFRPMTDIELGVLRRLLAVEHPDYSGLLDQLPGLLASPIDDGDDGGSISLSSPSRLAAERRQLSGSLPYLGVMKDSDGVPVLFAVFVDVDNQLYELEITKLDGNPIRREIDPNDIILKIDGTGTLL